MLKKPDSVKSNDFKSKKWDELTKGRNFNDSDAPSLELLCQWYQVVQRCMDDMAVGDGVQVAYTNDMNDIKALPQLSTLKQASGEIRALNKQLGICDEVPKAEIKPKETKLYVIQANREKRSTRAARTG